MDRDELIDLLRAAVERDMDGIYLHRNKIKALLSRLQPSGDGENLRQSAEYALMYLETGFVECHNCGSEVETKNLDAAYELRSALAGKDAEND